MDNAYYILAKQKVNIERLHICTWEFPDAHSYIEYGMEFSIECFREDSLVLYLAVPFIKKDDNVSCLLDNLANKANSRFIFNAVVKGSDNVGEDERDGSILKFENREALTILPCIATTKDGYVEFKIKRPQTHEGMLYFRVLVELNKNTIAIRKKGIAQTSYIYDFKINETRNISQDIYDLKKDNSLEICAVKKVFCLHAVPDNFVFSFIDSSKLKNIRKLEAMAFQQYLPNIKSIGKDRYNIIFLKDSDKDSYSLFTICTEETIGSKQIALAVGANILCSLLFATSSLNLTLSNWYCQIPCAYWVSLLILVLLVVYLLTPFKKKF